MTLKDMFDLGLFENEKWVCEVCNSRAIWVHIRQISKIKSEDVVLRGRCNAHKKTGDIKLKELREFFNNK